MVDYDKTFEFDYLMQADQESREASAREDSSNWSSSYRGRSFYTSWSKTKNTISNTDKWRIIIMFIIAVFVGLYYINEAQEKKSREETLLRIREMEAQGLLGTWINTWYEEVQELNSNYITGYLDESVKEKFKVSPYDWCSYVWDDWERHKCETKIEELEIETEEYTPLAVIPEAQIPEVHVPVAQIPEAHIPTATIPTSTNSNTQSWRNEKETYYNEINGQYYDDYDEYDASLEEFQRRWYNSYDEYFEDYFYSNREDLYNDYSDDYGGYNDDGQVYDYADLYYDFRDDHYWEYFD